MTRGIGRDLWRMGGMRPEKLYLLTHDSFSWRTLYAPDGEAIEVQTGDRVGNCWAAGRLRPGDIVLCAQLSGDCFYDFYLVDHRQHYKVDGITMRILPWRIGAYGMHAIELEGSTERDFHLLMAGEEVVVKTVIPDLRDAA